MNCGEYKIGECMHALASELWPYNRSLTGSGVNKTLQILKQRNPELKIHAFKSGEKVFDWQVPKQWEIQDAYIEHESGKRFAEFANNNLHVVGYSAPLDKEVSHIELHNYLHTQLDQPNRIPYVTSYYQERSGFCLSANTVKTMPAGKYRLFIDSSLQPGTMNIGECLLRGSTTDEIMFTTYICHPSMANNELSGPVLADQLLNYIRSRSKHSNLRYTYRVLFLVETIGAIAFLSRFKSKLVKNLQAGFVLSCVGDNRAYSHVKSRSGTTLADRALDSALRFKPNKKTYDFLSRGSDERQFCAPGIDLPVSGFCRTKYGQYPEYHTDADDLKLISAEGLQGSYDVICSIIDALENGIYPKATTLCEPQLGRRGLYPTISKKGSYDAVQLRMDLLAYADGATTVFDIAKIINQPLDKVNDEIVTLIKNNLIEIK
jgi:aminopeptidase-like protein